MSREEPVPPSLTPYAQFSDSAILRLADRELAPLELPALEKQREILEKLAPTRHILDVVLRGLQALAGHKPPPEQVKEDTRLLYNGLEKATAVSGIYSGPITAIALYQSLLKLAGIDPDSAFPHGTWQFYVEYALREDSARHTVETYGFDTILAKHRIHLGQVDRMAAWVMASIYCLHSYDRLLQNEWRERVYLQTLADVMATEPNGQPYARLYQQWERRRPYGRGRDASTKEDYPQYRRQRFDEFLQGAMQGVATPLRRQWVERVTAAKQRELADYQKQMSILACLEPDVYEERKRPLAFRELNIGIIYRGSYYLLPIVDKRNDKPLTLSAVRSLLAALGNDQPPPTPFTQLAGLAAVKRTAWPNTLAQQLSPTLRHSLEQLCTAPILLNFDQQPANLPLSQIRQAERGIGSHAITLFDTGKTFVFDLSHIFFDGIWGAGIAEILTNEALAWGAYLYRLPAVPVAREPLEPLPLRLTEADWKLLHKQPRVPLEASGETAVVNCRAILNLRRIFKRRTDLLTLTVNDILVLYRAIHAVTYQPNPQLIKTLETLAQRPATRAAATNTLAAIQPDPSDCPAMLIPVDASKRSPRERLHPVSFAMPLAELDIVRLHADTIAALEAYNKGLTPYATFDTLQRDYLATLAVLGDIFASMKEHAIHGETVSVNSIKMLAHLPKSVQNLLNKLPEQSDRLNDAIKGREVFSNVGAVVSSSTVSRFMTAKDDNEQKTLVWGVVTDAKMQMVITLRDFRPHVGQLVRAGHYELANRAVQDYVDSYADGLNTYIRELMRITLASRETDVSSGVKNGAV